MSVKIHIIEGPLPTLAQSDIDFEPPLGHGALLTFEGVARPTENDRPLTALQYEAYEPMTSNEMTRLAQHILTKHALLAICVEHSTGTVANYQTSFRLRIASKHRAEGIAATDEFIAEMKKNVPIWKTPLYADDITKA